MVGTIKIFKDEDFWQVEPLVREFMNNDSFSPAITIRQMQDLFGPFFLVAHSGGKQDIQGYIMGGIKFENKNIGWVLGIFVKEEFRNQEIGYELLNSLILRMKKINVSEIRLTVAYQNDSALKLYRKIGFQEVDCLNEYYHKGKKIYLMKIFI